MRFVTFMMMILLVMGCSRPLVKDKRRTEFCEEVSKVCFQVASRLGEKFHLKMTGFGGDSGQGINILSYYFQSKDIVRLDEAREVLLYAIKEFEDAINQDDSLRPFLIEYPFDINRLSLSIRFLPMSTQLNGNEYVTLALFLNGKLYFSARDDSTRDWKYKDLKEETHEEALKLHSEVPHD